MNCPLHIDVGSFDGHRFTFREERPGDRFVDWIGQTNGAWWMYAHPLDDDGIRVEDETNGITCPSWDMACQSEAHARSELAAMYNDLCGWIRVKAPNLPEKLNISSMIAVL